MGGVNGFCYYIDNDFKLDYSDFDILENKGRFAPYHKKSGHVFLHDFGSGFWLTDQSEAEVRFRENFEQTFSKYQHLAQKTLAKILNEEDLFFVFYGEIELSEFHKLERIYNVKIGKDIRLVNVLEKGQKQLMYKNIITRYVNDSTSSKKGTSQEWQGDDEQWLLALDF